jgi:hypothetical protein
VIEVHPRGAQDILGIPRKQEGLDRLRASLENLSVTHLTGGLSYHELDAVTCALVGKILLEGRSVIRNSRAGDSDA